MSTHRSGLRGVVALGLVVVGAALTGCTDKISDKDIEFATLADVRAITKATKPDAGKLLDPRSPEEFDKGHLPGAENLQLPDVVEKKDSLDPRLGRYKTLVVYGNDPGTAVVSAMAKRLMRSGAKDVKVFSGGLMEWVKNGYPVERKTP